MKFQAGSKIRVKSDYQDIGTNPYRSEIGTILRHENNKDLNCIDNIVQFENGTIEPFCDYELEQIN
jgi:hypothetical protein